MSIALTVATAIAAVFPGQLSEEWKTLLQWHGNEGLTAYLFDNLPESNWAQALWGLASIVALAYSAAVVVGLFLFWRFARFGLVLICALTLALIPFDGLVVMTPLVAALYDLALVLDGVLVAMAYLPPVGNEFERSRW